MLNIVIFSKNRPAQLDLCLSSMKHFFPDCTKYRPQVLYTYTAAVYDYGYDRVKAYHPDVSFVLESTFKAEVLRLVNTAVPYTVFFVDDIVFKEPFSTDCPEWKSFESRSDIQSVSLRLCPRINYCYTRDMLSLPPKFIEPGVWAWEGASEEWRYCMTLDGSIYRTLDIYPLLVNLPYDSPNVLEGWMDVHKIPRPHVICFQESKIVNIPANRVQTLNSSKNAGISVDALNNRFISGERLSFSNISGVKNIAPHHEIEFIWE